MDCSSRDNNSKHVGEECGSDTNDRNVDGGEKSADNIVMSQTVDISSVDISSDCEITSIESNIPVENIKCDKINGKDVNNKENDKLTSDVTEEVPALDHCSSNSNVGKVQNVIGSVKAEVDSCSSDDSMECKIAGTEVLYSCESNTSTTLKNEEGKLLKNKVKVISGSSSPSILPNSEKIVISPKSKKMVKMVHVFHESIGVDQSGDSLSIKREVSDPANTISDVDVTTRLSSLPTGSSINIPIVKKCQNIHGNSEVLKSSSQTTDLPENSSGILEQKQSAPFVVVACKIEQPFNSDSTSINSNEIVDANVSSPSKVNIDVNEKFISPKIEEISIVNNVLETICESDVVMKSHNLNSDTRSCKSVENDISSTIHAKGQSNEFGNESVSGCDTLSISLPTSKSHVSSNSALNSESIDDSDLSVPCEDNQKEDESPNDNLDNPRNAETSTISASTSSQILNEDKLVLLSVGDNGNNLSSPHNENCENSVLCTENICEEVPNTSNPSNSSLCVNAEVSKNINEHCIRMPNSCQNSSLLNEISDQSCCLESPSKLKSQTSERSQMMSEIALKGGNEIPEVPLQGKRNSEKNILMHDSVIEKSCQVGSPLSSVQRVDIKHRVTRRRNSLNIPLIEGDEAKSIDVSPTKSAPSVRSVLLSEIASKSVSDNESIDITLPFKIDNLNTKSDSPKKSSIISSGFPRIVLREKSNKPKKGKKHNFVETVIDDKTSESTGLVLDSNKSDVVSKQTSVNDGPVKCTSVVEESSNGVKTDPSTAKINLLLKTPEVCLMKIKESVLTKYGISLQNESCGDMKKNIEESGRKSLPRLDKGLKENTDVGIKERVKKRKLFENCEEEKPNVKFQPRAKKPKISKPSKTQFNVSYRKKLPLRNVTRPKNTNNCIAINRDKKNKVLNATNDVSKTTPRVQEERQESDSTYEKNINLKCNELNIKTIQINVTKLDQDVLLKYGVHLNELKMTVAGGSDKRLGNKMELKRVKESKKKGKRIIVNVAKSKNKNLLKEASLPKEMPNDSIPPAGNESTEDINVKVRHKHSRKKVRRIVKNVAEIKHSNRGKKINSLEETSKKAVLDVDSEATEGRVFKLGDRDPTKKAVVNVLRKVRKNGNIESSDFTESDTVDSNMSAQKSCVTNSDGEGDRAGGSMSKLRSVRRKISTDFTDQDEKSKADIDVFQSNAETIDETKKTLLKTFENKHESSEKGVEGNDGVFHADTGTMATKEGSVRSLDNDLNSSKKTSDLDESLRLDNSPVPRVPLLEQTDCDVDVKVLDKYPTKEITLPKDSAFNLKVAVVCLSKINNNELLRHGITVDHLLPKRNKDPVRGKAGIVHLKSILSRRSEQSSSNETGSKTRKRKRNVSFDVCETVQEGSVGPPEKIFRPNLT